MIRTLLTNAYQIANQRKHKILNMSVEVTAGENGETKIVVTDDAGGFDEKSVYLLEMNNQGFQKIFELGASERDGGTGLGTAQALRIIELHGGVIAVENDLAVVRDEITTKLVERKGARFTMTVPKDPAQLTASLPASSTSLRSTPQELGGVDFEGINQIITNNGVEDFIFDTQSLFDENPQMISFNIKSIGAINNTQLFLKSATTQP